MNKNVMANELLKIAKSLMAGDIPPWSGQMKDNPERDRLSKIIQDFTKVRSKANELEDLVKRLKVKYPSRAISKVFDLLEQISDMLVEAEDLATD